MKSELRIVAYFIVLGGQYVRIGRDRERESCWLAGFVGCVCAVVVAVTLKCMQAIDASLKRLFGNALFTWQAWQDS